MKCLQPTSRGTNFNRIPHYNLFYVSVSLGFCPSISSCFSIFFYLSKCFSLCAFLCLCISLYLMCFFFFPLCVPHYVSFSISMSLSLCLYPCLSMNMWGWFCLQNHAKTLLHAKGNCVWGIIDHISFSSYVLL
jgi:hypothetical protein